MRSMTRFFFSSRRRHTRCGRDWSSDVCSSDLSTWLEILSASYVIPSQVEEFLDNAESIERCVDFARHDKKTKLRSEERRVGKECRSRWSVYHSIKKMKRKRKPCEAVSPRP